MAQHRISNQELLAAEMWSLFSPGKTNVCKMPLSFSKNTLLHDLTDYIVIVFLFAWQSIFFLFVWFGVLFSNYLQSC